ncbi:uncharacterized protein G2W53_044988 [Senna tora]|uniref:Uncharacterized protein n=1 Tax=Senna tora TaxID=362788 RepID=A0A834VZT7_9FABA|nr:uncharacterized protein G2W53_044988 [Senna tora]
MIHAPPFQDDSNRSIKTTPVREPTCLTHLRNESFASLLRSDRDVVRNMLRHDPRPSHAKRTPIGASKPLRFLRSDRDLSSGMLRHDPRSSHAKTTPIGASQPLRFANTTRADVFDSLAQEVFCLEERGSCLNISRTTNRGRISETFTNYEAKDSCASESNTSVRVVFANRSGFDAPIGVVLAWVERGSCLNIFRTKNRDRISETFTNYEAKDLLRKVVLMLRLESSWHGRSVDHVLTYSGCQIVVGSQKPSRITRQKTCCASESKMSVRIVFANRSGFDAPIGVVLAWEERRSCLNMIGVFFAREERGSCLNMFRITNRGRISETFTNYEAKDSLCKSMDHVLTYSGRQIAVGSQKPSRITRQKTSVRVVFANRSAFDAPIGVVLAWEERGSCFNIFQTTNRGQISETFTNYEAKDSLCKSVDHVLTYSGRQIAAGSQKPSRITRQKIRCASESNTRFALYLRTGVVLMLQLESSWHERSVDHVLTYSGRQIAVGSQKPSQFMRQKIRCASESNMSIRIVFANRSGRQIAVRSQKPSRTTTQKVRVVFTNRSGFDAPIGVVLAWEERGSCLNIFWTTNRGRISETFTNYEAKHSCASESNTSVRVVFANRSGFDAPIGVVLAWEERGSCLNIFQTINRGRITETFTNYEVKDWLRKSQKPSRITRQKTRCASESNTSVRIVLANHAPIGVVLAWEERGSCLNIFRTTNRDRNLETFTNNEAKHLLRKSVEHVLTYSGRKIAVGSQKPSRITRQKTSVHVVFANRSGFDAPIGVILASEERGSCLNIFRTTNRGQISKTFTNYKAEDLLRK